MHSWVSMTASRVLATQNTAPQGARCTVPGTPVLQYVKWVLFGGAGANFLNRFDGARPICNSPLYT